MTRAGARATHGEAVTAAEEPIRRGEAPILAYETMRGEERLGSQMPQILLRRVSTRQYRTQLPEMVETLGASRSSVSRKASEASTEELKRVGERRLEC